MNKIGEVEDFDDLDDGITYCVYCYDEVPEWKGSCCVIMPPNILSLLR